VPGLSRDVHGLLLVIPRETSVLINATFDVLEAKVVELPLERGKFAVLKMVSQYIAEQSTVFDLKRNAVDIPRERVTAYKFNVV
jgi:hypothetical protein